MNEQQRIALELLETLCKSNYHNFIVDEVIKRVEQSKGQQRTLHAFEVAAIIKVLTNKTKVFPTDLIPNLKELFIKGQHFLVTQANRDAQGNFRAAHKDITPTDLIYILNGHLRQEISLIPEFEKLVVAIFESQLQI